MLMCGRYTLTVDPTQLMMRFGLESADAVIEPRFNIAPTQDVAVVFDASPRTLSTARWGLVPNWAKDITIGYKMFNARAETLGEKPAFKRLLEKHRCLILADSFYEWQKEPDGTKIPTRLLLKTREPFAFAGLWDSWKTPQGEYMRSCTVITCAPNAVAARVHDRMPAILESRDAELSWLDKGISAPHAQSLLVTYPADAMTSYVVSSKVNSSKNEGRELIEEGA